MRVYRCQRPECPCPVILIEFEKITEPEGLLSLEAERVTKTELHDRKYHEEP